MVRHCERSEVNPASDVPPVLDCFVDDAASQ